MACAARNPIMWNFTLRHPPIPFMSLWVNSLEYVRFKKVTYAEMKQEIPRSIVRRLDVLNCQHAWAGVSPPSILLV